ncbi:hypothetical protein WN990_12630 [Kitasatospora purpeofusca]|uniref:hypothetical protein n=1 Tax=Kitasatospora purpeofusca TaxID=67352 RepID=UPI0030F1BE8E
MNLPMDEFGFRPTHVAPPDGLPSWAAPDPAQPASPLDPLLPLQLLGRAGDWAQVLCSNGWTTWVDGRLLLSLPGAPPAATGPPARTADPRPALAEAEGGLARYRSLLEDLAVGGVDLETFRDRARGLRIGLVVDGERLWVFDPVHDRWSYCDGLQLHTYAVGDRPRLPDSGGPAAGTPEAAPPDAGTPDAGPPPDAGEPTRLVGP